MKISLIGYGQFGRFMTKHLRKAGMTVTPIKTKSDYPKISKTDLVIFAVPYGSLETAILWAQPYITPNHIIVDVTSTKVKPLQLLSAAFPENQVLGTHPIFGPQSGKHGISGLPLVLCNISCKKKIYSDIKRFCKKTLDLKVIEQSPKQHDHEMAHIMGLSHFIGRALKGIQIKNYRTSTESYKQLIQLRDLLVNDSWNYLKPSKTQTHRHDPSETNSSAN